MWVSADWKWEKLFSAPTFYFRSWFGCFPRESRPPRPWVSRSLSAQRRTLGATMSRIQRPYSSMPGFPTLWTIWRNWPSCLEFCWRPGCHFASSVALRRPASSSPWDGKSQQRPGQGSRHLPGKWWCRNNILCYSSKKRAKKCVNGLKRRGKCYLLSSATLRTGFWSICFLLAISADWVIIRSDNLEFFLQLLRLHSGLLEII